MVNKYKYTNAEILRAICGNPELYIPPPETEEEQTMSQLSDNPRLSSYGNISTIAARLDCSSQTVRNYLAKETTGGQKLRDAVEQEKRRGELDRAEFHHDLISKAEKALDIRLDILDMQAIKLVLERLDKDNYSSRQELTGVFTPEHLKMLEAFNMTPSQAVAGFMKILEEEKQKQESSER